MNGCMQGKYTVRGPGESVTRCNVRLTAADVYDGYSFTSLRKSAGYIAKDTFLQRKHSFVGNCQKSKMHALHVNLRNFHYLAAKFL